MDACLALLLLCSPALQSIHLGEGLDHNNRIISLIFRAITSSSPHKLCMPAAKTLRDIDLAQYRQDDILPGVFPHGSDNENTVDVLSFFYLPHIQSFKACIEKPAAFNFKWPRPMSPHARTLKKLDLKVIGDGYLDKILAATPNLEILRWNWTDYPETPVGNETIKFVMDLSLMASNLSHVKKNLKDLTLSVHIARRQYSRLVPVEIRGPLTVFCDLGELRRLEVPLPFLVGFAPECDPMPPLEAGLPESIEHLLITDDLFLQENWHWTGLQLSAAVQSWLSFRRNMTPHLRSLTFVFRYMQLEWWNICDLRRDLEELGKSVGVKVSVVQLWAAIEDELRYGSPT